MNNTFIKYNAFFAIWLSLFFLPISNFAQLSENVEVNLDWIEKKTDDNEFGYLTFEGATHKVGKHVNFLAYEEWISLGSSIISVNVELIPGSSESLDKAFLDYDEREEYSSSYELEWDIKRTKKGDFLHIYVVPIRKLKSGNFEKLLDFQVEVEKTPGFVSRAGGGGTTTAENSVLAEGEWYKIAIGRDGVYRLTYNDFQSLGVDPSELNPNNLNLYGNGGTLLPFENDEFYYDDLQKNSITFVGGEDGVFNSSDYILFYGKGPDKWTYEDDRFVHTKHYYSDSAYYYIRVDDTDPKRIQNFSQSTETPTHTVNEFDDYRFIENNSVNLVSSGREFFGDYFDYNSTLNFSFNLPNLSSETVLIESNLVARSVGAPSSYTLSYNGQSEDIFIDQTYTSATSLVAKQNQTSFNLNAGSDNILINFQFNGINAAAEGWLDWLRINAMRDLLMSGTQMQFRNTESVGAGNVSQFNVGNANIVGDVWDITDITNVSSLGLESGNENFSFTVETDELRQFIAFANVNFLSPSLVGRVNNQNLHAHTGVDMIIVSSPLYLTPAEELADLHRSEGLTVEVVTPQLVYNEFSSGNPDVTAIKKYMIHLYDSAEDENERIRYLLLFGDASYKGNKSLAAANSSNVICYQSRNSLSPTNSYVSDDYFAFLEPTAGESSSDDLLIGVGRIPAKNYGEAANFVEKIKIYSGENTSQEVCSSLDNSTAYGSWRNVVAFVADDRDGNSENEELYHMNACEEHADTIYTRYNDYNVEKIYMDSYQQFSTPGGERYPDGVDAIRNRVENGALVVTYIGHGGERGWAHERILDNTTIQEFTNINKMPVFFTATCELARYDNPDEVSAGEFLLHNQNGGAIAMLTTTRIVFSGANRELGRAFFNVCFENENMEDLRLGDIASITKNTGPQLENTRNFSLLGDPAMKIAYPKKQVYTTEVNGLSITEELDTIRALQQVTIKGYVGELDGTLLTDFNGFVYPTVYDKKDTIMTLDNDNTESEYDFDVFQSILYKGKASVTNGEFEFSFIVPKDIDYVYGTARVSYYAVDGSLDANGHTEDVFVGGIDETAEGNSVGPTIQLFLNDSTFVSGGITDESPLLLAKVFDENGINTTGAGIGHDISAVLDGQTDNAFILNNNYEADLNTFQSGEVRYQFSKLPEGMHNLKFKVWDVHNNSAEAFTEFVVAESADLALAHVLNYPNPFTTRTEFFFEHNQACEFLEVQIQVYTVSGKLVKTINRIVHTEGFRSEGIAWDGRDDFGDQIGKGVYVYRIKVKTPSGSTAEETEKLVILK